MAEADIAVVGVAGRFPGAPSLDALWDLLVEGREGLTRFAEAELGADYAGLSASDRARYVPCRGVVDGIELFDARFFRLSDGEADLLDPQHRLLLEVAWEALDNAGMTDCAGTNLGVFTSTGFSQYLVDHLLTDPAILAQHGALQLLLLNDKDFLPTRLSYLLNVHGPSVALQTGCSSSLVALHYACASLARGECDAAIVGGVSLSLPQQAGYVYSENMIGSRDGHCRAFDQDASGTVRGNGACAVIIKPLARALAERDHVWAVIKGSAINNDGRDKIGFTAPSAKWQAAVIASACERAGVAPETIAFVETHGTGTPLGDPIEAQALKQALGASPPPGGQPRWLGAVKTNLGHLDAAAGLAGLAKICLSLRHEALPPTLHFRAWNQHIDVASAGFAINTSPEPWPRAGLPRRAGLSSFGVGGTNVHVIVEEAPARAVAQIDDSSALFVLAAKSASSFERLREAYRAFLRDVDAASFAHVAHSSRVGRRPFELRAAVVATDASDAIAKLARCRAIACPKTYRGVAIEVTGAPAWLERLAGDDRAASPTATGAVQAWLGRLGVAVTAGARGGVRLVVDDTELEIAVEGVRIPVATTGSGKDLDNAVVGALWAHGVEVDWARFAGGQPFQRIPLPAYPFDRTRHWIARPGAPQAAAPAQVSAPAAAPADLAALEAILLAQWRALLGRTRLGVRDNLFEAGATSLAVGQFTANLLSEHAIAARTADCYEEPTVEGLARLLGRRLGFDERADAHPDSEPGEEFWEI